MTLVTKMIARTFIILMAVTNWLHRQHNDEHGDQGKHVENSFSILESAINCSYPTPTHLLLIINIMNKPPSPYKLLLKALRASGSHNVVSQTFQKVIY